MVTLSLSKHSMDDYEPNKSQNYDSDMSTCESDDSTSSFRSSMVTSFSSDENDIHNDCCISNDQLTMTPRKESTTMRCISPISPLTPPFSESTTTKRTITKPTFSLPSLYPLCKNDIYPSLTVTLSDIQRPQHTIRTRTKSCSTLTTPPPTLSTPVKQRSHTCASPPPMRRTINLSISIPPKSPLPVAKDLIHLKSKQAQQLLQIQNQKLQSKVRAFRLQRKQRKLEKLERKRERQQQRLAMKEKKRKSRIVFIPSNHRLKVLWDALTILVTIVSALQLHTYIRDRSTYEYDAFLIFTNIWFGVDVLLNFITDHRSSDGTILRTGREVWGRYLTTWFAVDALSLLPWERMFIRPIIIMQNRRNIVAKWFFRSKGVVKVTRFLGKRKYFIKYFGKVSKETKKVGVGGNRLLRLLIKYLPKYLLFYRNMKGVLLLKTLRQVHYLRKFSRGITSKFYEKEEIEEEEIIFEDIEEDDDDYDDDDDSICTVDIVNSLESNGEDMDYDIHFSLSMDDRQIMEEDEMGGLIAEGLLSPCTV